MKVIESCMGKCVTGLGESNAQTLNGDEVECMKRCSNKYFDSTLLIQKELNLYTEGSPYMS